MKNFARTDPRRHRRRDRFRTSQSEMFTATEDDRTTRWNWNRPNHSASQWSASWSGSTNASSGSSFADSGCVAARTADFEGSRRRTGRHQGADPPDEARALSKLRSGRGRENRVPGVAAAPAVCRRRLRMKSPGNTTNTGKGRIRQQNSSLVDSCSSLVSCPFGGRHWKS